MLKRKILSLWEYRLTRFVAVGGFNTVFDTALLIFFYKVFGLPEVVANTFSVTIAVSLSYFLNHRVVFRYREGYSFKKYIRFLLITGLSILAVQNTVIYLFTHVLWKVSPTETFMVRGHELMLQTAVLVAAKLVAICASMIFNFLLYKYVIFAQPGKPGKSEEADEVVIV